MTNPLKIVLDTNALISVLSRKLNFGNVYVALSKGKFYLCITTEILLEYEEKLKQFFNDTTVNNFLYLIDLLPNVQQTETYYNLDLIEADKSDNKFVDCAFACNADYIVTNDKHFDILKTIDYPKFELLKIEQFAKLLNTI